MAKIINFKKNGTDINKGKTKPVDFWVKEDYINASKPLIKFSQPI
jgi:hypothetical protein